MKIRVELVENCLAREGLRLRVWLAVECWEKVEPFVCDIRVWVFVVADGFRRRIWLSKNRFQSKEKEKMTRRKHWKKRISQCSFVIDRSWWIRWFSSTKTMNFSSNKSLDSRTVKMPLNSTRNSVQRGRRNVFEMQVDRLINNEDYLEWNRCLSARLRLLNDDSTIDFGE